MPPPLTYGKARGSPWLLLGLGLLVGLALGVCWASMKSPMKAGSPSIFSIATASAQQAPSSSAPPCEQPAAFNNQFPGSTALKDYRELWQQVYKPEGFCLCAVANGTDPCWLRLWKPKVDCSQMFKDYLHLLETYTPVFPAPQQIPEAQRATYLLHGHAQLDSWYISDEPGYKKGASDVPSWGPELFEKYMAHARARDTYGNYQQAMRGLYPALDNHPVKSLAGTIFGSNDPWLEALFFAFGAKQITTVEFRETRTTFPNHAAITPAQWARGWLDGSMREIDWVASYSSLEHDGLGRYGDPMNPWGDVETMQRLSCYVKQGGLAFIAVPTNSQDRVTFNAHRVYGPVRWPLMAANWEVLGVYVQGERAGAGRQTCRGLWAWLDTNATRGWSNAHHTFHVQPTVVLRNVRSTPCQ